MRILARIEENMGIRIVTALILLTMGFAMSGCADESPTTWFTYPAGVVNFERYTIYPAQVVISNVSAGALMDTWTSASTLEKRPDYNWKRGDPLAINIHSGYDRPVAFLLIYEITTRETFDVETGLTYFPAPIVARDWIILADTEVIIPPRAIAHIPIRIQIPSEIDEESLPERWEFKIFAIDTAQGGGMVAGAESRWLINMR